MASSIETGRRNPLSSWWWRIRHSAWLLAPVLGFGTFSFVGFLYCALRVRTRKWWIGAAITFVLSTMIWVFAAIFFEPETDASQTPGGNFTAAYLLVVWAGQILYGFIVNRDYLSWRATRTAWYEQPVPNAPPLQAAPPADPDATRQAEASHVVESQLAAALPGEGGEFMQQELAQLHERAQAYPDISDRLLQLAEHLSELFSRTRKRGTDQQLRLLQSQYQDIFAKLFKALADDYYGDILRNPQYWSNAEDRLAEVREAVEAVDLESLENIRQVNESRDLEFEVALDSLTRTVAEPGLSDVYTDRER